MASVQSDENCPKCKGKGEMIVDCYYRRGVTYGHCRKCGYRFEEDSYRGTMESSGGFGSYYVQRSNGVGYLYSFKSQRDISKTIFRLKRRAKSRKVEHIKCQVRVNGRFSTIIFGGYTRKFRKIYSKHGYLNDYLFKPARETNAQSDFSSEIPW